ncbi:MAG: 6-phospho-beta-glucosidase [Anaerolineae bacterium]|nr:6-phospho-beta-glucosidase [Anaerolineae bacterium]
MKVTVIGGGSTYTPELVSGFIRYHDSFPITELALMDIDAERLEVVGGFARRMVAARGEPFAVTLHTDRRAAVAGAAYVTTQLRVGHMAARREDEYLGRRWGLVGQETTGIGGFAKALRTIPVLLALAEEMRTAAPGAPLINFTNPSGLVTQALRTYAPDIVSIGLCNIPIGYRMRVARQFDVAPERVEIDMLGLNHLTWFRGAKVDGEDVWPAVFQQYLSEQETSSDPSIPPYLMRAQGMVPSYYLRYFYRAPHVIRQQQEQWPPSRAEQVMAIEEALLAKYADPTLTEPPPELEKRGGAYYSTAAVLLLRSLRGGDGMTHVVNVPHAGAVPGWPEDWVLELPCRVDREGPHPLPAEPLPEPMAGMIHQIKSYELLTAKAAVTGDRDAALLALVTHPLGPDADRAPAVLDDLLRTHAAYLPQFA